MVVGTLTTPARTSTKYITTYEEQRRRKSEPQRSLFEGIAPLVYEVSSKALRTDKARVIAYLRRMRGSWSLVQVETAGSCEILVGGVLKAGVF